LAQSGGMLGFSLYPHHLQGGSACTLRSFCHVVARAAGIDKPWALTATRRSQRTPTCWEELPVAT
jgi:Domain of unknown function (DUF4113)